MSESEGKKELSAIARSVDALFPPAAEGVDVESGIEEAPEPPNVTGDSLTGAPVLPDMPEPASDESFVEPSVPEAGETPPSPLPDPTPEMESEEPHAVETDEPGGFELDEPESQEPADTGGEGASAQGDDPGAEIPPPLPDASDRPEAVGPEPSRAVGPEPSEAVAGEPVPGQEGEEEEIVRTPLDEAVDAYLDGDRGRSSEIETLAGEMLDARELGSVARSVGRLAAEAGEPPDGAVMALARSIATPLVYERLAGQIGSVRGEEQRRRYFDACRNLGEPIARAIRDHLAESTDRHARRIHCEALVEMGAPGREIIEEMAVDENRFLARNAVAILGETGGDRAVELVTGALANPDARVRREALRSLAKLGDEESGELVVGLLEDSDSEVRIAAATAAGELHVERAVRTLVKMLDETKDPDEAVALMRALGQLGDPGAVKSIERQVVPKLFRTPRTDVRIVGYRALHQIGTPHARRLLNQAVDDKDAEVRSAVKEILGL